jgi:hypothetical protein
MENQTEYLHAGALEGVKAVELAILRRLEAILEMKKSQRPSREDKERELDLRTALTIVRECFPEAFR